MKYIALVLGFLSSTAFACPNLSGEFVNQEFGTYYSISQDGCELVQFHYDEGIVDAPTDGIEYLVNEYDIVVEEGKILANVKLYSSWKFKGAKLIINQRAVTTFSSGEIQVDKGWSEKFLNKKNDLVTVEYGHNSKQQIIDNRVK